MDLRFTQKTVKFGGGKIMVWGYIQYGGVREICRVEGNINSLKYQEVLAASYIPNHKRGHILQQDETDETKINLYQNDGKKRVWRRKGTAHDPKHTTSSVKHGGGSVMAWACMAANGTGSLVFIDDVTADKSSRMNSKRHSFSVIH